MHKNIIEIMHLKIINCTNFCRYLISNLDLFYGRCQRMRGGVEVNIEISQGINKNIL